MKTGRTIPRMLAVITGACLVLALAAVEASAHYVYEVQCARSGTHAHTTRAEVSHGGGAGYVKVTSTSVGSSCSGSVIVADHWAKWDLLKQNPSSGSWGVCSSSGDVYSSQPTYIMTISHNFGSGQPPCGQGFYQTWGHSGHNMGSSYLVARVLSGAHGLPPCIETNVC